MYINGIGAISPQLTEDPEKPLLSHPMDHHGGRLSCVEPDYSTYIDPKHLRRMSRILKMGMAASTMALREAGVQLPDGILTGTGYGCLEDTGTFLEKIIDHHEQALSPTPFIQSTHNTIGSQIGLILQCQGYNQTYTHEGLSFEGALLDAMMELREHPDQNLLTGGVDEITNYSHAIMKRFGVLRNTSLSSLQLLDSSQKGTLQGEGAVYFSLTGTKNKKSLAGIDSIQTFHGPSNKDLVRGIQQFIKTASSVHGDLDLVLLGKCGDAGMDKKTDLISVSSLSKSPIGHFKHLCGEYPTSTSFALWLGARIIQTQHVPEIVTKRKINRPIKNVLIYNPYLDYHHSLIWLHVC